MIYLIYGPQEVTLKNRLDKILKENFDFLDDFNLIKMDAFEVVAQDIAYEADSQALGYDKKAVVVRNPYFLGNGKEKVKFDKEQNLDILQNYINNPNPSTDLFFIFVGEKLNERSNLVKAIQTHGTIVEIKNIEEKDWTRYIRTYFEKRNVQIDIDACSELAKRVEFDITRFVNEAEKLTLYSSHITIKDIELLVARPLDDNAFAIFDNLIHGNNKQAIKVYRDLLVEAEEPVRLISLLANQFRFLSEVLYLQRNDNNIKEIAKELGVNEYRVKINASYRPYISYKQSVVTLNDLYKLDYAIKSGEAPDRFYAFEMFLLNFSTKQA